MSTKYQVVEKDDFGTDWHQVRYQAYAMEKFDSEEKAQEAANKYLTEVNCNNSLTRDEKWSGAEAYMMIKESGCFLGTLDGEQWYLKYPKDIVGKLSDGSRGVIHSKGDPVMDSKYYELEGKTEVAIRPVPGT